MLEIRKHQSEVNDLPLPSQVNGAKLTPGPCTVGSQLFYYIYRRRPAVLSGQVTVSRTYNGCLGSASRRPSKTQCG